MLRNALRSICVALVVAIPGLPVVAQDAVPGFRYIGSGDVDFFGADLDALFDTDLPSCVRACSANPSTAAA